MKTETVFKVGDVVTTTLVIFGEKPKFGKVWYFIPRTSLVYVKYNDGQRIIHAWKLKLAPVDQAMLWKLENA
jgi:hypothetical protein